MDNMSMVDLETLSTKEDAVILSLGLVVFSKDTVHERLYREFDVTEQIASGRRVSRDTQDWWRRTNPEELHRLLCESTMDASVDLIAEDVESMMDFWKAKEVWSRGYMDFGILMNLGVPLQYWQHRDVRTLDVFLKSKKKATHNALEDCEIQVEQVQEVMRGWDRAMECATCVGVPFTEDAVQSVHIKTEQSGSCLADGLDQMSPTVNVGTVSKAYTQTPFDIARVS